MEDIIRFVKLAPEKVIANHMEALNHCPNTRSNLKKVLSEQGLLEKTWIPEDGQMMEV